MSAPDRGAGAIIVLSRIDSARLPGKALRPIAGRPLLGRVLDQVRATAAALPVVVATTTRALDDAICEFATAENVATYRGDTNDVLARCIGCAGEHALDWIVRISGDSPFIDPALIDDLVGTFRSSDADILTNVFPRSYPLGMSVEVVTRAALQRIAATTSRIADREHVTLYAYENTDAFAIVNRGATEDRYAGLSLSVDTEADLRRAEWIAGRLTAAPSLETCATLARTYDTGKAGHPIAR